MTDLDTQEREKYNKAWNHDAYRKFSPGEQMTMMFLIMMQPSPRKTLVDFGAGTGRPAKRLNDMGFKVQMVDIADNCLDPDVKEELGDKLTIANLWKDELPSGDYGFCTDVMEHIPTEHVDAVIENIMKHCKECFFNICLREDHFGEELGEHLHLTVKPFTWWKEKLSKYGELVESRDLIYAGVYWLRKESVKKKKAGEFALNTSKEEVLAQVGENIKLGLPQVYVHTPHEHEDPTISIACGGPSLEHTFDDLKAKYEAGQKVVALNGAHDWLIARGVEPSAFVMVDARKFNERFTRNPIDKCTYFLASQCHPDAFKNLRHNNVFIWHAMSYLEEKGLLDTYYMGNYCAIEGGSTVTLRALQLFYILGYRNFELYGFDSCFMDGAHHAYRQNENDNDDIAEVMCAGETFVCNRWMFSQAEEFIQFGMTLGQKINMVVHGDGLISHIVKTGAKELLRLDEDKVSNL